MGFIRRFLGPKSKYDKDLPYTYKARVSVDEDGQITNTFFSDTICGLVEYLADEGVEPGEVEILEVSRDGESVIAQDLYVGDDRAWLGRPEICRSFEKHYPGHIHGSECSFSDRDKEIGGK